MANPYYIPTKTALERILPYAQIGLQMYGLQKGLKADEARIGLEKSRVALAERESRAKYGGLEFVEPGGLRDTGEAGVLNLPGGRAGTLAFVPGLEQRAETRERRKLGLLEAAGRREEQDPLAVHNQYMVGTPDKEKLGKIGTTIPAISAHITDLTDAIDTGRVRNRWDVYRFIKDRNPEIAQSLDAEIARMKKSGQDTGELEEVLKLVKSKTFAEQVLHFPREDMPKTERLYETTAGWKPRPEAVGLKKPTKGVKPTEAEKKKDYTLNQTLLSIIKDKTTGELIPNPSATRLDALSKAARASKRELVKLQLAAKGKPGILWDDPDIEQVMYLIMPEGTTDIDPEYAVSVLVSDYGMSEEDARTLVGLPPRT